MPTYEERKEALNRLRRQHIPLDAPPGSLEEQLADKAIATIHEAVSWAEKACELGNRRAGDDGKRYGLTGGELPWDDDEEWPAE